MLRLFHTGRFRGVPAGTGADVTVAYPVKHWEPCLHIETLVSILQSKHQLRR